MGVYTGTLSGTGAGVVGLSLTNYYPQQNYSAVLNFPAGLLNWGGGTDPYQSVTNTGFMTVGGATLVNVSNTGTMTVIGSPAVISVTNTGLIDLQSDGSLFDPSGQGSGLSNSGTIRKSAGTGTSTISCSFTDTNGTIDAQTGTINFSSSSDSLNGTTFTVAAGAEIDFANGYTQTSTGSLNIQVAGAGSGQFGQVAVNGDVSLSGALSINLGTFAPALGTQFEIIDNEGADPVAGTFAGLPEGAILTADGQTFTITYQGGDGNDVVLTRSNVQTTPTVTASDAGGTYSGSPFPATAEVAGTDGVFGPSLDGVSPTVTYYVGSTVNNNGFPTAPTAAGTYTAVASFAGSADYTAAQSDPVVFTIAAAPLTVTANDATKVYGSANPAFSVSYAGFVNSEDASVLGGSLTFTTTATAASPAGSYPVTPGGLTADNYAITFVNGTLTVTVAPTVALYAVGSGPGGAPLVNVYNPDGSLVLSFDAYDASFRGGVFVAVGDVNGDGVPDIITGAGAGGGPHVKVFDGAALMNGHVTVLDSFFAYDATFTGGVRVAAGDVNNDGKADIVTGAGPGGGPHVKVFSGADLSVVDSFYAFGPTFTGGVSVAAGDVNGDGKADIITGAGPGGGPHVKVFSGADLSVLDSFFAFDGSFHGGVTVAAGDVNGDGKADIVTGAGPGGGPHVKVFNAIDLSVLDSFYAYSPTFVGGVNVAAADLNGIEDIITGAGPGGGPHVKVFDGTTLALLDSFYADDPTFLGGVFVG